MRSASGSKASRVCMGILTGGRNFASCRGDGFPYARRRGAAGNVVNRQHVFELHEIEKIGVEVRVNGPEIGKRQVLQFAAFFKRKANRLPDLLMRDAEWIALACELS